MNEHDHRVMMKSKVEQFFSGMGPNDDEIDVRDHDAQGD